MKTLTFKVSDKSEAYRMNDFLLDLLYDEKIKQFNYDMIKGLRTGAHEFTVYMNKKVNGFMDFRDLLKTENFKIEEAEV